jgi:predicted esterase
MRAWFSWASVGLVIGAACGGDDPPPTAWEAIASERLAAEAATDCPAAFQGTAPVAGQNEGFDAAGQSRGFWLVPAEAGSGPRPLLVAFHGTGGTGQGFATDIELGAFAARGFHVVAPDAEGNGTVFPVWDAMREPGTEDDPNPDLEYFDQLVACMAAHYEVDRNRIYVAGHSAGGIMTNHVLRRRSELLAGGIVASGVLSLTAPADPMPLDEMFVLVTWGGMDDEYSGSGSGVEVPEISFVEQASLATAFYETEPAVGQANCSEEIGHSWLHSIHPWMVELLVQHPKGLPGNNELELPPLPDDTAARCTTEPFEYTPPLVVECPTSTTAGCAAFCQLAADCVVENSTIGPALSPQITMLGFSGEDNVECGGCITRCETEATTAPDAEVLTCVSDAQATAMCGPGVEGGVPFIDTVNTCCDARMDSPFCVGVCEVIATSELAIGFFPTCEALTGMM